MSGSLLDPALARVLAADLTASGAGTVPLVAPFTGEVVCELPRSTAEDVRAAARAARRAQRAWAGAGVEHRRRVLLRAHDILLRRRRMLLDAVQTETGKTRGQAFEEVFQSVAATRHAAVRARRALATQRRASGLPLVVRTRVHARPRGLVGVVTPWNYPLSLAVMDIAPALATGNAVVQKVDDQAPLSVLAARRAFVEAGVPADLWAVVAGDGTEVGAAITDVADHVCFTGSTATGTAVAERAARRLVPVTLELGGKNPLIVLDDVDPVRAALDAAYACFSSMGQLCVAIERVYVLRGIADRFVPAFVRAVEGLVQGPALDYSTDVGSLATRAQLDRTRRHVDDARAHGARVLTGGTPRPELGPLFFAPTVLADIDPGMACAREETFGAVASVTVVADEREAVARANDSALALNAAVMGRSLPRARRVADRLVAGSVNINEGYRATFSSVDAPMGGLRASGIGRRNGIEGLRRFTDAVTVAETTGLLGLPRTGSEFARLERPMLALARVLKSLRRP